MKNKTIESQPKWKWTPQIKKYALALSVVWTLAVVSSLTWNYIREHNGAHAAASEAARSQIAKDIVYRRWNAGHGGVYVPVTESTPPNPFLTDVEERDIETPSGRQLTLVNPAYMTRQVHELGRETEGIRGHITCLNPIRPANAPDPWERRALETFEQGAQEFASSEMIDGNAYLRLMRSLITEQACLKCHARQGYKEGDIRGGISVSVSMAPYLAIAQDHINAIGVTHGALWLLGLVALIFGVRRIGKDAAKRDQAEEAAHVSQQQLEQTFASLNDVVFVIDPSTRTITTCNQAVEDVFGYSLDEVIGCNTEFLHVDQAMYKRFGKELFQALEAAGIFHTEFKMRRKDGTIFSSEQTVTEFRDVTGERLGVVSVIRDITERKQAEEALLKSEERYKNLFNNAEVGIFRTKQDGSGFLDMNEKFLTIIGYTRDELKDRKTVLSWADHEERKEMVRRLEKDGNVSDYEFKLLNKNNEVRNCITSLKLYSRSEILEGSLIDITERKQVEEELKRSLAEKQTLLNEVHHRVKNNLQIVISLYDLAKMQISDQKAIDLLNENAHKIQAISLVHQQLYQSEHFDRIDLKEHLQQLLNHLAMVYGRGKQIETSVSGDNVDISLGQAVPNGMVVSELITNAFKHGFKNRNQGTLEIEITRQNSAKVGLIIRNDGNRIADDSDPFEFGQTLGLKLIKDLVEKQLRGTIEFRRAAATEFIIEIPLVKEEQVYA